VFAIARDPVAAGLVESLAGPAATPHGVRVSCPAPTLGRIKVSQGPVTLFD
jgi:hypothetical protein